jgi:hypothetical protein
MCFHSPVHRNCFRDLLRPLLAAPRTLFLNLPCLISDRAPMILLLIESDSLETRGYHHGFDLLCGEPLLQSGAKAVERIRPHRVKA